MSRAGYGRGKEIVNANKEARGCEACGEGEVAALDHHHLDPETKSFTLSGAAFGKSAAELEAEMAKCVVLCATCHRLVHAGLLVCQELGENDVEPKTISYGVTWKRVRFGGL